ncbi:MAG: ABC transporter substrate-binding protein [Chloroflexota bacterium]
MGTAARSSRLTRRRFLVWTSLGLTAAGLLQACGQQAAPPGPSDAKPAAVAPTAVSAALPPGTAPTPAPAATAQQAPAQKPAEAPKPAGAPKRGGTLTALVQNDWTSLDPPFEIGAGAGFNMLYDQWVVLEKDPAGNWLPKPALLAEWDLKPDQATLKLQSGVKFHDGTPWDAKAAKWNLDRIIFHPQSRYRGNLAVAVDASKEDAAELEKLKDPSSEKFEFSSKAVEVVNDTTVRIKLSRPWAPLLSTLSEGPTFPVSPTAFAKAGKTAFGKAPVGAGPFKFVEWVPNTRVVLEKNPDYWRKGADGQALPYLDKVIYRLVIDDSVRLLELKSGNAQFTDSVQGKDIAGVRSDPSMVFIDSAEQGISRRLTFDGKNPNSPFVKHPELRRAIQHGIDRDALAKTLGFDSGTADKTLFPPGSFAHDPNAPYYAPDIPKAQQIVKDVLAKNPSLAVDGKIPVNLTVISRAVDRQQSEILKQMASNIGFNLDIEVLERAAYVAKIVQLPGKPGADYHISTVQNPVTPLDPDSPLRAYFHSAGGQNYPHVSPFDEVIDKAAGTYDIAERKKLYSDFMKQDYDQCLMVYMWFQKYNWLHSAKVKGFTPGNGGSWNLSGVWME